MFPITAAINVLNMPLFYLLPLYMLLFYLLPLYMIVILFITSLHDCYFLV
jgi:hypothetical protein